MYLTGLSNRLTNQNGYSPYDMPENMPLEIFIAVVLKPSKSLFMFDNKDNSC